VGLLTKRTWRSEHAGSEQNVEVINCAPFSLFLYAVTPAFSTRSLPVAIMLFKREAHIGFSTYGLFFFPTFRLGA
jgi:hypothetical protein